MSTESYLQKNYFDFLDKRLIADTLCVGGITLVCAVILFENKHNNTSPSNLVKDLVTRTKNTFLTVGRKLNLNKFSEIVDFILKQKNKKLIYIGSALTIFTIAIGFTYVHKNTLFKFFTKRV